MKCHKPNTDQEVEFTIFANGIQCDEYVSPSSTSDGDPNVLECFVPVTEGDRLTVSGSFTGTLLHGSFDLLADGSFLADKRIEGSKSGESKYYKKRKLDIKTVFDTPAEEGRTSIFSPDKVVEGNLYVKALRDAYEEAPSNGKAEKLGVGSLAIICSFNQDTHKKYTEKYPSITCGDWASRSQDDVADGGIAPSYEAGFKITNEDSLGQKFVFYYRQYYYLAEAGCLTRPEESTALEPGSSETFVQASPEPTRKGPARKGKKTAKKDDNETAVAFRATRANSIFTTPPPSETSRMSRSSVDQFRPTPTPAPTEVRKLSPQEPVSPPSAPARASPPAVVGKKRKLFGQSLPSSTATSPLAEHARTKGAQNDFDSAIQVHQEERDKAATLNHSERTSTLPCTSRSSGFDGEGQPYDNYVENRVTDLQRLKAERDRQRGVQESAAGGLQHVTPFSVFNKTLEKLPSSGLSPANGSEGSVLPIMSDGELADAIADAEAFLGAPSPDNNLAPDAQIDSPSDAELDVQSTAVNGEEAAERSVPVKQEEGATSSAFCTFDGNAESKLVPPENTSPRSLQPAPLHGGTIAVAAISSGNAEQQMTSPPPSRAESLPYSQSSQPTEDLPPCKLTADQIRPFIPPHGIKLRELNECFDRHLLPNNRDSRVQFRRLVREVAVNENDRYYLKRAQSSQSASQAQSSQQKIKSEAGVEQPVGNAGSTTTESTASETASDRANTPASCQHLPTPPASLKKRPASAMATSSRESTPSKKARFSELSSKKADLLKQIEAKRQRKGTAQKALENQRKLREGEERRREEAEMKEIEMLEKMAADEDEEYEDLMQAKAEEEEAMEEARKAREKAEGAVRLSEGV